MADYSTKIELKTNENTEHQLMVRMKNLKIRPPYAILYSYSTILPIMESIRDFDPLYTIYNSF